MKRERSDVVILLMVLLIFSATVGMLHADKNVVPLNQKKTNGTTVALDELSPGQAVEYLSPLIISRSIEKIVDSFRSIPAAKVKPIVAKLIQAHQTDLTRDDLIKILTGIVGLFSAQTDQFALLDLVADYPILQQGAPLLFQAAASPYAQAIPVIIAWTKEKGGSPQATSVVANAELRAFEYAVTHNAAAVLSALHERGVQITPQQATDLLWKAVAGGKKPEIVRFLINKEHAEVNDARGGYTPLMQAAKHNQLGLVKALVESGAQVNKLIDPAVGTALQIALERGYTTIELYLRDKGARE